MGLIRRYRATGADLPFGDPTRAHDVAMEGYFWRFSDPRSDRVLVALCGVHRRGDGRRWANVALAVHPGDIVHAADVPTGRADADRLGVTAGDGNGGTTFDGGPNHVRVNLDDASLDVRLQGVRPWPRRAFGGLGLGHVVPALSQHWHPHVLGGRARGSARIGSEHIDLDGYRVYAEKNWGRAGFPERWWWGQAHDFPDADACVAFAGGEVGVGPVRTTATAIVVRAHGTTVRLGDPLLSRARVRTGEGWWQLDARGPQHTVAIQARATAADAHVLPIPLPATGHSVPGALQHFAGELHVTLRRRGRVVFTGTSPLAGLEHGGRVQLEHELARRRHGLRVAAPSLATDA